MVTKIYAQIIKSNQILHSQQIGTAVLDENRVSAEKYNALKKAAFKAFPNIKKGCYMSLVTDSGLKDTFGGYPANSFVRFE